MRTAVVIFNTFYLKLYIFHVKLIMLCYIPITYLTKCNGKLHIQHAPGFKIRLGRQLKTD